MAALDTETYPLSVSTTVDPDWGIVQDYSDDGTLHLRGVGSTQNYIINARWDLLDTTGRNALESFFSMNALEEITLSFDGHDYVCRMISPPTRRYTSGALSGLSVTLRGARS